MHHSDYNLKSPVDIESADYCFKYVTEELWGIIHLYNMLRHSEIRIKTVLQPKLYWVPFNTRTNNSDGLLKSLFASLLFNFRILHFLPLPSVVARDWNNWLVKFVVHTHLERLRLKLFGFLLRRCALGRLAIFSTILDQDELLDTEEAGEFRKEYVLVKEAFGLVGVNWLEELCPLFIVCETCIFSLFPEQSTG